MLGCTETEKQSEKNVSNLPIAPPVVIVYPVPVVEETEETEVEVIQYPSLYTTTSDTVYETIPKDTLCQYKILSPGIYHNDEADPNWASLNWVELFKNGEAFIRKTELIVEPGYDALMDDDGEKTGWKVLAADSADTCYFLFSGFKPPRRELLDPIIQSPTKMLPRDTVKMKFKRKAYTLHASGNVYKHKLGDEWPEISSYRLILEQGGVEQIIFATFSFSDRLPEVYFIGDLDGDNKLDVILDASRHYNTFEPVLYLSTIANKRRTGRMRSLSYKYGLLELNATTRESRVLRKC